MEPAPQAPKPNRALRGRLIAAATAVLLGAPLALLTSRHWLPFFDFGSDEARPMMEIGSQRAPLPPTSVPTQDSLSLVRGEKPPPPPPAPPPAPSAQPAPGANTAPKGAGDGSLPLAAPKRYPKLQKKEWSRTEVKSILDTGEKPAQPQIFYQSPQEAPQEPSAEKEAPPPPSTAAGAPPAAAPQKPRRQPRPKPAPPPPPPPRVIPLASPAAPPPAEAFQPPPPPPRPPRDAPIVEPGHTTTIVPDDKTPEPSPQMPKYPGDPCPTPGWWKNGYTGLCYKSKLSCEAADNRRGAGTCKL